MKLLGFGIVLLGCFHGSKLIFFGVKIGLAGDSIMMLNLVIIGLALCVFPMHILQWIAEKYG